MKRQALDLFPACGTPQNNCCMFSFGSLNRGKENRKLGQPIKKLTQRYNKVLCQTYALNKKKDDVCLSQIFRLSCYTRSYWEWVKYIHIFLQRLHSYLTGRSNNCSCIVASHREDFISMPVPAKKYKNTI